MGLSEGWPSIFSFVFCLSQIAIQILFLSLGSWIQDWFHLVRWIGNIWVCNIWGCFYRVYTLHSKNFREPLLSLTWPLKMLGPSVSMFSAAPFLVGYQLKGTAVSQGTLLLGVNSTPRFVCSCLRCLMYARLAWDPELHPFASTSKCWHSGVPPSISAPST